MTLFTTIILGVAVVALAITLPMVAMMSKRMPPGDLRPFVVPLALALAMLGGGAITAWVFDPPHPNRTTEDCR